MKKILILFGVQVIVLAAVASLGYRTASLILDGQLQMFEYFAKPAIWMTDAKALSMQSRRFVSEMLLNGVTPEQARHLKGRRAQNTEMLNEHYAGFEKIMNPGDAEAKRLLDEVRSSRARVSAIRNEITAVAESGNRAAIDALLPRIIGTGDIGVTESAYITAISNLSELLEQRAERANADAAAEARRAQWLLMIVSAAAALFGVVMTVLISRMITKPLNSAHESVNAFAHGDLTTRFDLRGKDEVAAISKDLQAMSDTLSGVIGSVNDAGCQISETVHDFSAMVEETHASVEEFRGHIDEMVLNLGSLASASEEVNASVQEVAAGAQTTAEKGTDIARKVDDAMLAGDKGINAVRSVVAGVGRVAESSHAATDAVMQLGDRARQIQSFVSQIGGIADQTNLLALNAAIEAARAGEAGRGFAVVAEEVRKLAEDSNVAAKNIAELAGTITSEIEKIVSFSQANASESGSARTLSAETETEINNMIANLRDIAHATQDLAAVAQQQAASSEEIAESVQNMSSKIGSTVEAGENIRMNVGEVAAASERIAVGSEGLSSLSSELRERLAFFKTDESAGKKTGRMRALPG